MSLVDATLEVGAMLAVDAQISSILTIPVRPNYTSENNKVSFVPNLVLVGTTKGMCVTCITSNADKNKIVVVRTVPCHYGPIYDMVYNNCVNIVATAGHDGTCTIMPLHLLLPQELLFSSHNVIHNCANHRKRSRESIESNVNEQHEQLCQSNAVVQRLRSHTLPVVSVRFTFDGNTLLSLGVNGRLIIFDLSSQHIVFDIECNFIACTMELSSDESSCFVAGTKLFCVDFGNQEQRLAVKHEQRCRLPTETTANEPAVCSERIRRQENTNIMLNNRNNKRLNQTVTNNVREYTWNTEESCNQIYLERTLCRHQGNNKIDNVSRNDYIHKNGRNSVADDTSPTSQSDDDYNSHSCNNVMDKELSTAKRKLCIRKLILNESDGSIVASCILLHESKFNCNEMQDESRLMKSKRNNGNCNEKGNIVLYWPCNSTYGKCINIYDHNINKTNTGVQAKHESEVSLTRVGLRDNIDKPLESNVTLNGLVLEKKNLEQWQLMWSLLSTAEDNTKIHDKHNEIWNNAEYLNYFTNNGNCTHAHTNKNDKDTNTFDHDNEELEKNITEQRQRKLHLEKECARLMHELKKLLVNKAANQKE